MMEFESQSSLARGSASPSCRSEPKKDHTLRYELEEPDSDEFLEVEEDDNVQSKRWEQGMLTTTSNPNAMTSPDSKSTELHKAPRTLTASTGQPTAIRTTKDIPLPLPRPRNQSLKETAQISTGDKSPPSDEKQGEEDDRPPIQIPSIPPISSGIEPPPNLTQMAVGLEGKFVDEFGNILDWNGQVLGRVKGDLPSMVGRKVSSTGEIIGKDGEVVGYVAENDTVPPAPPSPQPIERVFSNGTKVDHTGRIVDNGGRVIGHVHSSPLAQTGNPHAQDGVNPRSVTDHCCFCGNQDTGSTPSPSEVSLDVRSTNDGIQLIIKIPTVFKKGGQPVPSIRIGKEELNLGHLESQPKH